MWVELYIKQETSDLVFTGCRLQDEELLDLPPHVSTTDFINFVSNKANVTTDEMRKLKFVKISMTVADYNMYVNYPAKWNAASSPPLPDVGNVLLQFLDAQMKVLREIAGTAGTSKPRFELVKPDPFDGVACPEAWLSFYEYACEKNYWTTEDDKKKNMRLFLSGVAKKWYDLQITNFTGSWQSWKENFLKSFRENPVESWDKAIFWKYKGGSLIEYFYEKQRLLRVAEPKMPQSSIVSLIIHGLPKELQKQVQVQSPTSVESLLEAFRHVSVDPRKWDPTLTTPNPDNRQLRKSDDRLLNHGRGGPSLTRPTVINAATSSCSRDGEPADDSTTLN